MSDRLVNALIASPQPTRTHTVHVLGGLHVSYRGERIDVPDGSKRLLVFVALNAASVDRRHAAGTLWPFGDDLRAAGNLRSALWRLRSAGIDVLIGDKSTLSLRPGTVVDVDLVSRWAERVLDDSVPTTAVACPAGRTDALDLLPGWYDDWVVFERERLRQRVLHALDALSRRYLVAGRHAEAVDAALIAVQVDPLRESAQRALMSAHLAEGNRVEARRAYRRYRRMLTAELGIEPGEELAAMVGECGRPNLRSVS